MSLCIIHIPVHTVYLQTKKNIKRRLDIPECIVDRELFLKYNLWKGREILFWHEVRY